MTSFAAIAFLIAFTGCSKNDLYDQGAVDERNRQEQEKKDQQKELTVNEKYAAAFEKAFGKVGPNVDWGFGRQPSSTRAFTRAGGVTFPTSITFPEDYKGSFAPDLTGVPSYNDYCKTLPNATQYWAPTEFGYGVVYIDGVQNIHINGGTEGQRSRLYLKPGTYDFTGYEFYLGKYVDLFLLEGATLTLDNTVATNAIFDIYIADGAELIANGENGLKANSGLHIYNHGTLTCSKFEANTTSVLYNSGTVKVTGTVSAESNSSDGGQSFIVNNGTIECADVVVNAGAVLNIYKWTVSGTTRINSNNSGWINNGQWTTQDYAYIGGSENVINNCYLWVKNDFEMNISSVKGSFKINSEGGVLAQNFYGGRDSSTGAVSGPFKIEMAENAVFVVENDAQFESGRGEIDNDKYAYGIFGPLTGGYAVFQAKNIVREASIANTWGAVTYRGHLYVSAETHFAQGNDGMESHKFIIEQDGFSIADNIYAAGFKSGKPSINIPQTPCSPGFQGGDPLYRVIAEDLSASEAGDFDFNDVVFDVVKAEGGVTYLKLICAGGVLPLRVRGANQAEGTEIHSLFGEDKPNEKGEYKMYNTGLSPKMPEAEFTVEGTYTTPEQIRNIIIEVWKNDKWMELKAETGKAACKILVDDTFTPVPERKNIADENGNFTNYVQGQFVDDFWWK